MDKIRTLLRIACGAGAAWTLANFLKTAFILSSVPFVCGQTVNIAGIALQADFAYAVTGAVLLTASVVCLAVSFFGLRCARLVRSMNALRSCALFASVCCLPAIVACIAIDGQNDASIVFTVSAAIMFAIATLAGEISRGLIAAHMLGGDHDVS